MALCYIALCCTKQCAVNASLHCGSKYGLRASCAFLFRFRCNSVHEVPTNNLQTFVITAHEEQCYCLGRNWVVFKLGHWKCILRVLKVWNPRFTKDRVAVRSLCDVGSTRQVQQQQVQDCRCKWDLGSCWKVRDTYWYLPTFRQNLRVPSSGVKEFKRQQFLLDCLTLADLQVVPKRLKLQIYAASRSKRARFIISFSDPVASVQLSAANMKQPSVTAGWWLVFWTCRVLPSLVLTVPSSSAPYDSSTVPYTGHTAPCRSLSIHYSLLSVARRVQSGAITVVMYSARKWSSKV